MKESTTTLIPTRFASSKRSRNPGAPPFISFGVQRQVTAKREASRKGNRRVRDSEAQTTDMCTLYLQLSIIADIVNLYRRTYTVLFASLLRMYLTQCEKSCLMLEFSTISLSTRPYIHPLTFTLETYASLVQIAQFPVVPSYSSHQIYHRNSSVSQIRQRSNNTLKRSNNFEFMDLKKKDIDVSANSYVYLTCSSLTPRG